VTNKKGVHLIPNQQIKDGVFPHLVIKASLQFILREESLVQLKPVFEKFGYINTIEELA